MFHQQINKWRAEKKKEVIISSQTDAVKNAKVEGVSVLLTTGAYHFLLLQVVVTWPCPSRTQEQAVNGFRK